MERKSNSVLIGFAVASLFLYKFFVRKGGVSMLDLYVGLVSRQRRTCNPENKKVRQVPKIWRDAVLEDLKALGLDADGMPVKIEEE
ncbi:CD1375 family protein [Peptoniphilus harei]|uniref:CD1375 family protein n=1 Tax=Peptoniphilus harei TaxID=54005 RepID=UPI0011DD9556|nr:CD1375 family protein [Peptoniphilus harei]